MTAGEAAALAGFLEVRRFGETDEVNEARFLAAGWVEREEWTSHRGTPDAELQLTPAGKRELERLVAIARDSGARRRSSLRHMGPGSKSRVERASGIRVGLPGTTGPNLRGGAAAPSSTHVSRARRTPLPRPKP